MEFAGRGILLDVEGTTSAIAYVYEVMFPFARRRLTAYLDRCWDSPVMAGVREQLAADCQQSQISRDRAAFEREVAHLMDQDAKTTGLKQLQGLIWEAGFNGGELVAHVFDDVPPALHHWQQAGIDLRIYSSGSVHAQQLFFSHTTAGDLLHFFTGHYDTKMGAKRDAQSYARIASDWHLAPTDILFLSDVVAELDAARTAGMATGLCVRPGNALVESEASHPVIERFDQIKLVHAA